DCLWVHCQILSFIFEFDNSWSPGLLLRSFVPLRVGEARGLDKPARGPPTVEAFILRPPRLEAQRWPSLWLSASLLHGAAQHFDQIPCSSLIALRLFTGKEFLLQGDAVHCLAGRSDPPGTPFNLASRFSRQALRSNCHNGID